jgi:hypothetical protein
MSMLGLSYVLLVFLTDIPLKCFTSASICGMTVEATGAHILLSLSPLLPRYGHRLWMDFQTVPLSDLSRNPCLKRLRDA